MSALTLFGFVAVGVMFLMYWFEERSPLFVLVFAVACAASSLYGFLAGTPPFAIVEALWAIVALQRFARRRARMSEA
jgi:hypothetical protein